MENITSNKQNINTSCGVSDFVLRLIGHRLGTPTPILSLSFSLVLSRSLSLSRSLYVSVFLALSFIIDQFLLFPYITTSMVLCKNINFNGFFHHYTCIFSTYTLRITTSRKHKVIISNGTHPAKMSRSDANLMHVN